MLAALADGTSRITGLLESDDTRYMKECLKQIGASIEIDGDNTIVSGVTDIKPNSTSFYVGNAGTVARFFSAAAALSKDEITIDGDMAMRKRPIAPLLNALSHIGFIAKSETGFFPINVGGNWTQLNSSTTVDADNSSQYISALMIMAPFLLQGLTIQTKSADLKDGFGYIDLTVQLMKTFGIEVETLVDGHKWHVNKGTYKATNYTVEADASAMTYIWAAETLTGGNIETGFNPATSEQPDANSCKIIKDYRNIPSELDCSMMQDSVPTIAVVAALSDKKVRLTGLKNLRVKECDRIEAINNELSKFGDGIVHVEGDDLCINGSNSITADSNSIDIETYDDHRIAMAFSLIGLVRDGVTILDPGCASKTYPNYWDDLGKVGVSVEMQ